MFQRPGRTQSIHEDIESVQSRVWNRRSREPCLCVCVCVTQSITWTLNSDSAAVNLLSAEYVLFTVFRCTERCVCVCVRERDSHTHLSLYIFTVNKHTLRCARVRENVCVHCIDDRERRVCVGVCVWNNSHISTHWNLKLSCSLCSSPRSPQRFFCPFLRDVDWTLLLRLGPHPVF